jgi:hypothetical protein
MSERLKDELEEIIAQETEPQPQQGFNVKDILFKERVLQEKQQSFEDPEEKQNDNPGEEKPRPKRASPEESADLITGAIDFTLTTSLTKIHKWKFRKTLTNEFGTDAILKLEEVNKEVERCKTANETINLQPEHLQMLLYQHTHKAIIADIPFTDEETAKSNKTLARYIEANGGDLPPNISLLLLGVQLIGPRIVDVIVEKV